jgi:hypothetical protein
MARAADIPNQGIDLLRVLALSLSGVFKDSFRTQSAHGMNIDIAAPARSIGIGLELWSFAKIAPALKAS